MIYKHKRFFLIVLIASLTTSIYSCKKKYSNPHPDVSDIKVEDVHIIRLDNLMFQANGKNHAEVFSEIENKYPEIFKSYTENFWGFAQSDSINPINVFDSLYKNAVENKWIKNLYDSVQLIYKSMDDVEKELTKAFKYYKYYFPDSALPQIYTYIGPFVYWTLFDNNTVGIELDMYMGKHFGYYGNYENNLPQYITVRCDKPYIVVNIMQSLMDGNIVSNGIESTMLDEMIAQGKMLYYLDYVLPDVPDSIKMGYSASQLQWCKDNEHEIWKFLADKELFFSKKTDDFRRYLDEAPSSTGMPEESPGRVAVWVGWQIVRAYMQENKNKNLIELFNEADGLKILKESGYHPGE